MKDVSNYKFENAKEYHLNSSVQFSAAMNLLEHFSLSMDEQVLDLGCGSGNVTVELAKRVPKGLVTGIDISDAMVNFCKHTYPLSLYPNLVFEVLDARNLDFYEKFSIVFSSFAIQWVTDLNDLFSRIFSALITKGAFIATIPLGISDALEKAIEATTSLPKWEKYFQDVSLQGFFPYEKSVVMALQNNQFSINKISSRNFKAFFPDRATFSSYVSPWFPFLKYLPHECKEIFFEAVMDRYFDFEPLVGGKVLFQFPLLDFFATKGSL